MALTPLDIQNKNFSVKMRGYNQDEVDDFLDMIVRDYEEAVQRNRELEKSLKHALNQSIIVAQDTADKVKTSASKESEVIVTSAQNRADEMVATAEKHAHALMTSAEEKAKEILTDATDNARQLATETNDLKKKTRVFHNNLLVMLQTQLEQVKSPEWEEILAPFSSYVQDSHQVIREVLSKELDSENGSGVNSEAVDTFDVDVVESDEKIVDVSESPEVKTLDDARNLLDELNKTDNN